jgi:hypothetical protein
MKGENPTDYILINRSSERQVDLIGNLRTSPSWIALFHFDQLESSPTPDLWGRASFVALAKTGFGTFVELKHDENSIMWIA